MTGQYSSTVTANHERAPLSRAMACAMSLRWRVHGTAIAALPWRCHEGPWLFPGIATGNENIVLLWIALQGRRTWQGNGAAIKPHEIAVAWPWIRRKTSLSAKGLHYPPPAVSGHVYPFKMKETYYYPRVPPNSMRLFVTPD